MFEHKPLEIYELNAEMIDGKRFYNVEGSFFPSVTTVLSSLSKDGLDQWVKRVGEEEATKIRNMAASRGTKVHLMCEDYVSNKPEYVKGKMPDAISLFKQIQPWLDENIEYVYNIEIPLHSKVLKAAGRCDLVAKLKQYGNCIVDYKTSTNEKKEQWIGNYFLQTTAYAQMVKEMYGLTIDKCVIVIAVETSHLQVFVIDPYEYYAEVLDTFNNYHVQQAVDLIS